MSKPKSKQSSRPRTHPKNSISHDLDYRHFLQLQIPGDSWQIALEIFQEDLINRTEEILQ